MHLTLLKDGWISDGSGAKGFAGDVLLDDGRIAAVGTFEAPADCATIDCTDCVVAPGFVDLHSHSDLQVLEDRVEKTNQGVTTEVVGNCGFSPYPGREHGQALRDFANGIFCGYSAWEFQNAKDYFAHVEKSSTVVDVRSLAGHGSLRVGLFGNRQDALSGAELDRMTGTLDEILSAGSCGLSTGLMYAPGSGAPFEEIEALCRVVAKRDRLYATHMRSYSFGLIEAIDEQLELARRTGCRLQISHLQAVGRANWDKQCVALEKLERAKHEGIDVEFDIYPYQAGSSVLTQLLPQWALDGGAEAMLARLADSGERARMTDYMRSNVAQNWSDIMISGVKSARNRELIGKRLAAIAEQRGRDPIDTTMDLIAEENGAVNMISFNQSEANLRELLTHELCSVISDGFYVDGKPHPRLYGTFPSLLGEVARDRKWMTLPEAVRKITSKPLARLKLADRGFLRPGLLANVTVFDAATISGPADYDVPDRPPVGIRHVFLRGREIN
ncbi:MAG TPA: amidohydrolase family protein [Bryobacteraceae bacterium]|nr:amidohydrolase family protein [Bryobacteraceae bacterium]